MTKNDFNSDPLDQADPLSATGMFLSSFGSTPAPSQEPPESGAAKPDPFAASGPGTTRTDWPAPPPSHSSPTPSASGPGEFTQMFRAMETRPSPSAVSQPPVTTPAVQPAPSQSAGEFTRNFVSGSTPSTEHRSPEQGARTVVEPPPIPPPAPNPPRMKGFSTPGVSDSASAEGSFTQFFKATPAPASTASLTPPAPLPVQSYRPPAPPPPMTEKPWQREPEFGSITKPADAPPSTPSATGLLSALSTPGGASYSSRQPEVTPYRPEPLPSYTPPPPQPSAMEAGSVTKLIQRLSQVPRETPPAPITPVTAAPAPPVSSSLGEPGEFTRMISGDTVKAALGTAAPIAATPPAPAPAAPPPIAMPHLAVPAVPHAPAIAPPAMPAPKAAAPPKIELPKIAPPAAPAFAAPKSKLEAMVPILLVINTFLLVVLLVVVVFALKAK